MTSRWPIDTMAIGSAACGVRLWKGPGTRHVTVVVKAYCELVHEGRSRLVPGAEIARKDFHYLSSPGRSVEEASDLAPYLPACDVTVRGHAMAAPGHPVSATTVRLAIARDAPLLDKRIYVYGDANPSDPSKRLPFDRMPLDYEHAFGGRSNKENPVGRGSEKAGSGAQAPNLFDPNDPQRTASFAPLSKYWGHRATLLGKTPRAVADAEEPELGAGFDWRYYQAAPPDQQIPYLTGDEWLVLDGMHPALPRVQTQLPGARAAARLYSFTGGAARLVRQFDFVLDTLAIDVDQGVAGLVWRASALLGAADDPLELQVIAGVQLADAPLAWPEETTLTGPAPPASRAAASPISMETMAASPTEILRGQRIVVPFAGAPAPVPGAPAPVPGAPAPPATAAPAPPPLRDVTPVMAAPPRIEEAPAAPPLVNETYRLSPREVQDAGRAKVDPFQRGKSVPSSVFAWSGTPREPPPEFGDTISLRPADIRREVAPFRLARSRGAESALRSNVPRRETPEVPIMNPTPLAMATSAWQLRPPQDSLTVTVKGTFDLVNDGPARLRAEVEPFTGDVHVDDDLDKSLLYPSDFALLKPRADVMLLGHAYPRDPSGTRGLVHFRVGDPAGPRGFAREVAVSGDRVWKASGVALVPGDPAPFERVPLNWEHAYGGAGHAPNPVGTGRGETAPPNLEDPAQPMGSSTDAPPPACFAPIPPLWKERWSKLGTFDDAWLRSRWPYYPADFDPAHFQAAPASQQTDHLHGDEPYEIVGARPERGVLRGALPALRVRAFALLTEQAAKQRVDFLEIPLRLDTAVFDAENLALHLVWRGLLEVSDDEAPEIETLFLHVDEVARDPMSLEDAKLRLFEAFAPETKGEDEPIEPEPPSPLSAEELAAIRLEVDARLAAGAAFEGMDLAGAELLDLDLSGRSFAGANLKDAVLRGCRFAGSDLTGANLAGADLTDADLTGADLTGADLVGAKLGGARLDRATLEDADLSGVEADGASFREARGANVQLAGASLRGARFDAAELPAADFTEAKLDNAAFSGATLPEIRLYYASGENVAFDGAKLDQGRCDDAVLPRASFEGARAPATVWEKSTLDGANFARAELTGASFNRASCEGANFSAVEAAEAKFQRAKLGAALFLRSNLREADLERADLRGADLRGANLHAAETWKAKLGGAKLDQAILTGTKLALPGGPDARA